MRDQYSMELKPANAEKCVVYQDDTQPSDSEGFQKAPIMCLNGYSNHSAVNPLLHGLYPSFMRGKENLLYPHLTEDEKVFGSYYSECFEDSLDRRSWFRLFMLLIRCCLPHLVMYSLFVTSKKVICHSGQVDSLYLQTRHQSGGTAEC